MTKLLKLLPLLIALALLAGLPAAVSGQETATVSFVDPTSYTVAEDAGSVSVSISISNSVSFEVNVDMSTSDGTARAGRDYTAISETVTFPANSTTSQTVDITITDDTFVEGEEAFSVSLDSDDQRVAISNSPATVTIEDDDTATVGFNRTTYEVQETSGRLTMCASIVLPAISCPVHAPFSVQLSVTDDTATSTSPADYELAEDATGILNFGRCQRTLCTSAISIINDRTVENHETFTVTLGSTGSTPDYINFPPAKTVEIRDDGERASVEFESGAFTANAGESLEIPLAISRPTPEQSQCPVDFDFDVHIADPDGAFAPGTPDPLVATFKACESTAEATATAAALNSFRTETFSLRLRRPSNLDRRIAVSSTQARLTVIPSPFEGLDSDNSGPWGMWSDRATVWVSDEDGGKIYAYNMNSMARDEDKDFNMLSAAGNADPTGIWSDGTTMWVADYDDGKIYAYRTSDKARDDTKDFNTLTDAGNTAPTGIWSNGATMWVADGTDGKIYAYRMSDKARDDTKDFDTLTTADNTAPTGIWSDGTTMWVADGVNDKIYAYSLSTKARDADKDIDPLATDQDDPKGLWSDGELIWAVDKTDSAIYPYLLPRQQQQPTVSRASTSRSTATVAVEADPARPSAVSQELCVSEVVDPDGGSIELGDTIEDAWLAGCPSITRGGRLAKYYTFDLPITTHAEIALDSHLDTYLVLHRGGLDGTFVTRDDDSGPSNNALISGVLPAGRYTIEATTFYADGVEADFTLSVRAVPRILYDGPVTDVASPGYAPGGPTMTVKLLPTLPSGTLEITIEDADGFGGGTGPLGGAQSDGGSAGTVMLALPRTSWVQYDGITAEIRKSGVWAAHTTADEQAMLAKSSTDEAGLGAVLQGLARILGQAGGASSLLRSLADLVSSATSARTVEPDESLMSAIFREAYSNCVSQVTVPWLVEEGETTGVRVSMPVTLSDDDYLSLAASFVASGDRPALAQLHNLLATCNDAPVCQPPAGVPE